MASDDEWEDGEILEDGEEVEDVPYVPPTSAPSRAQDEPMTLAQAPPLPPPTAPSNPLHPHLASNGSAASVIQSPLPPSSGVLPRPPLPPPLPPGGSSILGAPPLPSASNDLYPRKRLHSTMQDQQQQYHPTARHAPHRPSSYSARGPYAQSYSNAPSGFAVPQLPPPPPQSSAPPVRREFETYSPDLIVKYPRQVVASNVLLDFAHWMEHARTRLRLSVDDIQQLVLNVLDRKPERTRLSPFLLDALCPHKPLPTRVCVVLLGNVHPSVLQRYRSTLNFFDACSSVPCVLSKSDDAKRVETPLPELLYKFPRPPANTKYVSLSVSVAL